MRFALCAMRFALCAMRFAPCALRLSLAHIAHPIRSNSVLLFSRAFVILAYTIYEQYYSALPLPKAIRSESRP